MTPNEINRRVVEVCGLTVEPGDAAGEYWVLAEDGARFRYIGGHGQPGDGLTFDAWRSADDAVWSSERLHLVGIRHWKASHRSEATFMVGTHPDYKPITGEGPRLSEALCNAILAHHTTGASK